MEKVVPGKVVLVTIGYNFDWAYIDTLDKLMERITAGKFQVTECK